MDTSLNPATAALNRLQSPQMKLSLGGANGQNVDDTAREFEAMMLGQLLEPMWAGVKTDGAFGGGTGETVFRSMMIQEMGKSIAANGGIGLADDIKRSLLDMQEARGR